MTEVSEAQSEYDLSVSNYVSDRVPRADFQAHAERWAQLCKSHKEIAKEMDDITAWFSSLITRSKSWVEGSTSITVTVVRPQTPQVDVHLLASIAPGLAEIVTETKTVIDRAALKQMIELGLFDTTQDASRALSYKASAPSIRVSFVDVDKYVPGTNA